MGMLPVKHFVVRGKPGHATCDTLLSGVSKDRLPVKKFVVRDKQGHATCDTLLSGVSKDRLPVTLWGKQGQVSGVSKDR